MSNFINATKIIVFKFNLYKSLKISKKNNSYNFLKNLTLKKE